MTTKFLVVENGWEYNDEYYTNQDGYRAVKLFSDKEKADQYCLKRTLKFLKYNNIGEYGYDGTLSEICTDVDKFTDLIRFHDPNNSCISSDGSIDLRNTFKWPDNLPRDIQKEMAKCFDGTFFDVVEIEES